MKKNIEDGIQQCIDKTGIGKMPFRSVFLFDPTYIAISQMVASIENYSKCMDEFFKEETGDYLVAQRSIPNKIRSSNQILL